jgi:opacity protein-like surface antigen
MNHWSKVRILFSSLLVLLATTTSVYGFWNDDSYEYAPNCCSQPMLEIKTGYFTFSDSTMRKVYNWGGLDVQLCGSYPLWTPSDRWSLHAYGALELLLTSGKSLNDHQNTSLWSVPINIGLKPIYQINDDLRYYFAVGPRYFYIQQHNDSSYVYRNRSGSNLGFFANTGLNYLLCNCLVLDIFGEYSYGTIHFRDNEPFYYTRRIQIGGFTVGLGLGYEF